MVTHTPPLDTPPSTTQLSPQGPSWLQLQRSGAGQGHLPKLVGCLSLRLCQVLPKRLVGQGEAQQGQGGGEGVQLHHSTLDGGSGLGSKFGGRGEGFLVTELLHVSKGFGFEMVQRCMDARHESVGAGRSVRCVRTHPAQHGAVCCAGSVRQCEAVLMAHLPQPARQSWVMGRTNAYMHRHASCRAAQPPHVLTKPRIPPLPQRAQAHPPIHTPVP